MSDEILVMPRSLAIRVLHAAQIAQPESIRGVIGAHNGEPTSLHVDSERAGEGETVWATLWSHPLAAAIPQADELVPGRLSLVISLNTKGVLEMRAWRLDQGAPREAVLKIRD